jgi:hypothetical protein
MTLPPPPPPNKNTSYLGVGLVVLALVLVLGAVLLIERDKNKNTPPSVAQIKETFGPPQAALTQNSTSTTESTITPEIRGPQTASSSPSPITSQLYANSNLGFQMELTPDWQIKPFSASEIILTGNGGEKESVEAYPNVPADLNAIKLQLQNNSSIIDVKDTTFQNQPALSFISASGQQGLAVIYKNILYYIMGQLTTPPLSTFQFLQTGQTVNQNNL